MHRRTPALFAALAFALTACSGEHSSPLAPESAPGAGSPRLQVSALSAVSVDMFCEPGGICEATASGGSGSFSFAWTNATESFDGAKRSFARPNCYPVTPQLVVTVVATDDATGAQASAQSVGFCGSSL